MFVSAIIEPTRDTATLRLILHLITGSEIRLVGDIYLVEEMIRYAEKYRSETAAILLQALASKIEIIDVETKYIRICKQYIATENPSDIIHAAACLQSGSTLVTNDKHFNKIRDQGIIKVQDTATTIKMMLGI